MFETMADIPEAIAEFYHDVVIDDIVSVVENDRYDLKSWPQIETTITHLKGSNEDFVQYCIGKAIESDKWDFHDSYLVWMEECVEVDTYNSTIQKDENGDIIGFEPRVYPTEPVYVESGLSFEFELSQWKAERARKVEAIRVSIEIDGVSVEFDGDETSQARLGRTYPIVPEGETIPWTASSDVDYQLTSDQLKTLLYLAGTEQSKLWSEGRPVNS